MPSPPVIVTLIHGTFDRGARWTQDDSLLAQAIAEKIGRQQVLIQRFEWSGRNRQTDRTTAVNQLIDYIHKQSVYFPASMHFLVGHSHGGNIILWALEQAPQRISKSVSAAVTVSTPFLEFRPRSTFPEIGGLVLLFKISLSATLFLSWLAHIASGPKWLVAVSGWITKADWALVFLLAILAASAVVIWTLSSSLCHLMEEKIVSMLEARLSLAQRLYSERKEINLPFLCLHTKWDEIKAVFTAGNIVSETIRAFSALPVMTRAFYFDWVRRFVEPFLGGLAFLSVFAAMFIVIGNATGRNTSGTILLSFVTPFALIALMIVAGLPVIAFIGVGLVGRNRALDLMVFEYISSVNPSMVRSFESVSVAPHRIPNYLIRGRNFHTNLMYDPFVAGSIAGFISRFAR